MQSKASSRSRFIATRIISGTALERLQTNKVPFARVEDAAAAVLHLASDAKLNGEFHEATGLLEAFDDGGTMADGICPGRALTILPREFGEHGYLDLEMDDEEDDDLVTDLQKRLANVSIRVGTK